MNIKLTGIVYPSHNDHNNKYEFIDHNSNNKRLTQKMEMNPILEFFVTDSYEVNSHKTNEKSKQSENILNDKTLLLTHDHTQSPQTVPSDQSQRVSYVPFLQVFVFLSRENEILFRGSFEHIVDQFYQFYSK